MADGQRKTFDQLAYELGSSESPTVRSINSLVARNLATARLLRGITQEQLGQRLERMTGRPWSKATMSALERSADGVRVRQFDADDLVLLARALDMPLLFFFLPDSANYHPHERYVARPVADESTIPDDAMDAGQLMAVLIGSGDNAEGTIGRGDGIASVQGAIERLLGFDAELLIGADQAGSQLVRWRESLDELSAALARVIHDRSESDDVTPST